MKITHTSVKHPVYCHFGEKIPREDMAHNIYGFNQIRSACEDGGLIDFYTMRDSKENLVNKVSTNIIDTFLNLVIDPSEYEKIKISKKSVKGLVI